MRKVLSATLMLHLKMHQISRIFISKNFPWSNLFTRICKEDDEVGGGPWQARNTSPLMGVSKRALGPETLVWVRKGGQSHTKLKGFYECTYKK